jgi:serine O-acetyltransferase
MQVESNLPYYIWRCARTLHLWRIPLIPFLLQQFSRVVFCCLVPYKTRMGRNVHLNHLGMGIIINPDSVIGSNVKINQHVTIGGSGEGGCPVIEDDVYIGAGAKVLGGIRIGRGAKIGANAVVLCDVPEGATAVGIPARIIVRKGAGERSSAQAPAGSMESGGSVRE